MMSSELWMRKSPDLRISILFQGREDTEKLNS